MTSRRKGAKIGLVSNSIWLYWLFITRSHAQSYLPKPKNQSIPDQDSYTKKTIGLPTLEQNEITTYVDTPTIDDPNDVHPLIQLLGSIAGAGLVAISFYLTKEEEEDKVNISIYGDTIRESTLTANVTHLPDGSSITSYSWAADDIAIENTDSSSFEITASEVGKTITVTANITDSEGSSSDITADASGTVIDSNQINDAPILDGGFEYTRYDDPDSATQTTSVFDSTWGSYGGASSGDFLPNTTTEAIFPGWTESNDGNFPKVSVNQNHETVSNINGEEYFAFSISGNLYSATDTDYDIRLSSDDGSQLFLNDTLSIDHDNYHGFNSQTQTTSFTATDTVDSLTSFFERDGHARLDLEFKLTTSSSYFDLTNVFAVNSDTNLLSTLVNLTNTSKISDNDGDAIGLVLYDFSTDFEIQNISNTTWTTIPQSTNFYHVPDPSNYHLKSSNTGTFEYRLWDQTETITLLSELDSQIGGEHAYSEISEICTLFTV